MIHYNYDCDFKIAEPLYADAPFRYTYYAKSEKTVVAEYDGTDYHGCYPMGDMLIVPINARSLGLGDVKVRREYYLTDKDFTDGICNRVTGNVPLGIEIWRGETDGMETHEVKVVPAYQKGDPFTFDDMTDEQKQDIANRVPTKEPEREAAETLREANETKREEAEAIREANEIKREEAEAIREATYKNKVDRDDYAPKLTSGFADNLVGRGDATEREISFGPTAGDISIADWVAHIDRIEGSTVVWNNMSGPLSENHFYVMDPSFATLSFSNNIARLEVIKSHTEVYEAAIKVKNGGRIDPGDKCLIIIVATASQDVGLYTSYNGRVRTITNKTTTIVDFFAVNNTTGRFASYFGLKASTPIGAWVDFQRISAYNLTRMFGAGNEPTTIEEFYRRKPIGIDEYAYNEGELISTNVEGLKSVGFNLFNGVLERGRLMNGYPSIGDSMLYSPEYYRILPNAQMYARIDKYNDNSVFFYPSFYDSQKNYISAFESINAKVFTTPSNAAYLRFFLYESRGNVLPLDYGQHVCIHLVHTGYRNGEYEPYKEFRRSIPIKDIKDNDGNQLFPNGLLSAGSVYDEITATKAIKRIGVVDLGTLNWTASPTSSDGVYRMRSNEFSSMRSNSITSNAPNIVADKYLTSSPDWNYQSNESITVSGIRVLVYDKNFNTGDSAASFKSAMQGVMLYYELAEPIEVDLEEPLNLDYEVSDFGTEEVISSEPTTPMKADIIYQFNAVDRIRDNSRHTAEADKKLLEYENRISALEAMIANSTREGDEVLE